MTITKRARLALLAGVVGIAGLGGLALAQSASRFDPAQLPATKGRVAQYSLTPRGDVDGLILEDGTEIHLPPHLGTQLVFAVKPGDAVTVRGLRARDVPMVQAMQVTNDATNAAVTDNGPPAAPPHGPGGPGRDGPPPMAGAPMDVQGTVKEPLHGPRGDLNGVLLSDGTIVRMPPPDAQAHAAALAAGKPLVVRGNGVASPLGRVIAASAFGPTAQEMVVVRQPPPPPGEGPRGPGHDGPGRNGPGHDGPGRAGPGTPAPGAPGAAAPGAQGGAPAPAAPPPAQ